MNWFLNKRRRQPQRRSQRHGKAARGRRLRMESMESRLLLSATPVGVDSALLSTVASVVSADLYEQALADGGEIAVLAGPEGRVWQWMVATDLVNNDVRHTLYVGGSEQANPVTVHVLGSVFPLLPNDSPELSLIASTTPDLAPAPVAEPAAGPVFSIESPVQTSVIDSAPMLEAPVTTDVDSAEGPSIDALAELTDGPVTVEPVDVGAVDDTPWPVPDTVPIPSARRPASLPLPRVPVREVEPPATEVPDESPTTDPPANAAPEPVVEPGVAPLPEPAPPLDGTNLLGSVGLARIAPLPPDQDAIGLANQTNEFSLQITDLLPADAALFPAATVENSVRLATVVETEIVPDQLTVLLGHPLDESPTHPALEMPDAAIVSVNSRSFDEDVAFELPTGDTSPDPVHPDIAESIAIVTELIEGVAGTEGQPVHESSKPSERTSQPTLETDERPALAVARISAPLEESSDTAEGGAIPLATVLAANAPAYHQQFAVAEVSSAQAHHLPVPRTADRDTSLARAIAFESVEPWATTEVANEAGQLAPAEQSGHQAAQDSEDSEPELADLAAAGQRSSPAAEANLAEAVRSRAVAEWSTNDLDNPEREAARVDNTARRRYASVLPVISILALERITAPRRRPEDEASHVRRLGPPGKLA